MDVCVCVCVYDWSWSARLLRLYLPTVPCRLNQTTPLPLSSLLDQVCRHAIDLKRRALLTTTAAPPEPAPAAADSAAPVAVAAAAAAAAAGGPLVTIELVNQAARELQEKPVFKAVQEGLSHVQVRRRRRRERGRADVMWGDVHIHPHSINQPINQTTEGAAAGVGGARHHGERAAGGALP